MLLRDEEFKAIRERQYVIRSGIPSWTLAINSSNLSFEITPPLVVFYRVNSSLDLEFYKVI